MPLRKLKFECSECEKTVEKDGIFLQDNGNREGFCNLQCIYNYLSRTFKPKRKITLPINKPLTMKEGGIKMAKLLDDTLEEVFQKSKKIKLESPPQPPPGRPG
jgi:hypothetical protein